jgi:small-conductance mechanosensitive channel/CRP-like cAMP-binding protein
MHVPGIATDDYLLLAGLAVAAGFLGARYWKERSSLVYFVIQLIVFALFTGLLMAGEVIPYRPGALSGPEPRRVFLGALEIVWWLTGAWLAVGFLRAFIVLGQKPHEVKLVQELLAALIYLAAIFGIIAYVFDLPVKGLLATSGALAIVIGLALQSSLGDVFSGIVLNLERPYRVGDWVILDDAVQGTVMETNWRATHILTGNQDIAIIPNSVIAKSKIINCSTPTRTHGAAIRIKLEPTLTPAAACAMLTEVLLGSTKILRSPEPAVTIKDLSAEMLDFELSYSVADVALVGDAQNELFDRVYRAASIAGARFAPRLAGVEPKAMRLDTNETSVPERLLNGISLFASLTLQEKAALASKMQRKMYPAGTIVVRSGAVLDVLCIVSDGVLVAAVEENGQLVERVRLTPGIYFGERGLLTGEALKGQIAALTDVSIYEISKDALAPLLKARPRMVEELGEVLAARQLAQRTVLGPPESEEPHHEGIAQRFASSMKHLFSLH